MHPVFHISLLRRHQESPAEFETRTPAPPPPDIIDDHPEYEVEAIKAHRRKHRKLEFLVKWKDWPDWDSTWEKLHNLTHCADILKAYRDAAGI